MGGGPVSSDVPACCPLAFMGGFRADCPEHGVAAVLQALVDQRDADDLDAWYQDPVAVGALERQLDAEFGPLPPGPLDFRGAA